MTVEMFMEESQRMTDHMNTVIEETLISELGYNVGQQYVDERDQYKIMYKTFLTEEQDDKSDLIELLTFRAERYEASLNNNQQE